MEKLLVGVLGTQNSGKSKTWDELFGRRVRTGKKLRRLYLNSNEYVKVFLVSGSPEEREMYVGDILTVEDPDIVLCSIQYDEGCKETIDYFSKRDYYMYIQWINPGYQDDEEYEDDLNIVPFILDKKALLSKRNGRIPPSDRVEEIRDFIYGWVKKRSLLVREGAGEFPEGVILDISWMPYLQYFENSGLELYVPSVFDKLITEAGKDKTQRDKLLRLIGKWFWHNKLPRDFNLSKMMSEYYSLKEKQIIRIIPKHLVDEKVRSFCIETFFDENLYLEMSPKVNLLGEIIGEILGYSKKGEKLIIAKTKGLSWLVRDKITIVYHAIGQLEEAFFDYKKRIFDKIFPHLPRIRRIHGTKFIMWASGFFIEGYKATVLHMGDP
jgi:hypothetical protein